MVSRGTNRTSALASAGVVAADLVVEACGSADGLRAATVRDLARDLALVLSPASGAETPDAAVEAAIACADLATLAACNVSAFGEGGRSAMVAATHLAAGTARALATLAESDAEALDGVHAENVSKDVRSAGWKADLAVRQLA